VLNISISNYKYFGERDAFWISEGDPQHTSHALKNDIRIGIPEMLLYVAEKNNFMYRC
jgi:hypothetical protein